jgi:Tfp pilus assembly protein PilX
MMLRQLERLHEDERGMALIVSLMVAFVVLMLSTIIVAQSIHSLESSGYDRQRLTSVSAAEAGTNDFWQYLQTTEYDDLECDDRSADLGSAPVESAYTASVTFYRADGATPVACPLTSADIPAYVKVESTGTAEGEAARTIETYAQLTPIYTGFGAAIMAVNGTSFSNNFQVNGQSGNDGDVYILNGNLTITSSPVIYGNVYVPNGSATLSNNSEIKGDLWANGTVTVNNPSKVSGNAKSTTGNISGSGTVVGDATATGTTPISTVNGSRYPGTNPGPVPTQTFPQITSSTTTFTNAGYTLVTFSGIGAAPCTSAYNYIHNTGAGTWATSGATNIVIRIVTTSGAPCNFTNANNDVFTVRGNLAIINDGGFNLSQRSNWNGTSSPIKNVYFISPYSAAACTGTKDIVVGNNTNFDSFTNVFFYTPCTATMSNTNAFAGQVLAGTVSLSNQFLMTYKPVLVPGYGDVVGFEQSISYVREV